MSLESALQSFSTQPLLKACRSLFKDTLKIPLSPLADSPITPQRFFRDAYKPERHDSMENLFLVGRITDDSFHTANQATADLDTAVAQAAAEDYNGMFVIAVEMAEGEFTRSELASRTREINRVFTNPVIVVFKHLHQKQPVLSIGVISRREHKRTQGVHVLGKVSMIREIRPQSPHRGHIEILKDFSLAELEKNAGKCKRGHKIDSFKSFHAALEAVFNTELLNKRFYQELSSWYFWAMGNCHFPLLDEKSDRYFLFKDREKVREHEAKNLIRLLTRVLFVWFIKEKKLVPEKFFDPETLRSEFLDDFDTEGTATRYYKAILQNLFFATLNQAHKKREFRKKNQHHNTTNLLRYEAQLKNPQGYIDEVEAVTPFLNGGLFDCLDYPHATKVGPQGGKVTVYEDGFSDRPDNPLVVPDFLFFGKPRDVNLSTDFGDPKRKNDSVRGLIHILNDYKFTIVENTPIDQEIALDPELLGQVFENLLASYNPETKTTARKQTGSFYTPRPIVDYMVDESLKAHLSRCLVEQTAMTEEDAKAGLDLLFTYTENDHPFKDSDRAVAELINAIDDLKILDPACGSGAFPMGVLHKLVYLLSKLDPKNVAWEKLQLAKAQEIPDTEERRAKLAEIVSNFADNNDDYGRKLYLIENCLYGVDIQSIASQVTKLRFFISLIVDQVVDLSLSRDNFGIRPLPNLETKFITADTLIPIERPKMQGEFFELADVSKLQLELKQIRHELFSAKTKRTKDIKRQRDKELRDSIIAELKENGWDHGPADALSAWDPYNQNASAKYFDPEWMFGFKEFDIVIGNPPYGAEIKADVRKKFTDFYHHQNNPADSYLLFMERAHQLLKPNGLVSYIVSNTWLPSLTFQKIRRFLTSSFTWHNLLVIRTKVFAAVVDTNVILFEKSKPVATSSLPIHFYADDGVKFAHDLPWSEIPNTGDAINVVFDPKAQALFRKMSGASWLLKMNTDVYNGVKPFEKGKGSPPQTAETMRDKPFVAEGCPKPAGKNWMPLLRGSLIHRYVTFWNNDSWIQYGSWLAAPRNPSIFEAPEKLFVRQTGDSIIATHGIAGFVARNNLHIILPKKETNLLFLLGVLNSRCIGFLYSFINPEKGEALAEIKKNHVEELPIPHATHTQQEPIVDAVKSIVAAKQANPAADTTALEREIDQQVYALYGLTPEEIATVEGGGK
jgi:adenine-specific DNA-methyltransferase